MKSSKIVSMGCDPEFFIRDIKTNEIVESGVALSKLKSKWYIISGEVTEDGVQAELNPNSNTCRVLLHGNIDRTLGEVSRDLETKGYKIDLETKTVKLTKEQHGLLSSKAKKLGCVPSFNVYGENPVGVNPDEYLYRSVGGHIHLGVYGYNRETDFTYGFHEDNKKITWKVISTPEIIVPMLDIVLGNTCVMLDRDNGNKKRREVYGRAGEYRAPKHGIEYRTLSNFWLSDRILHSLVFGLARQAVTISTNDELYRKIISAVNMNDIITAINTNDSVLARKNWNKIKHIIADKFNDPETGYTKHDPIKKNRLTNLDKLLKNGISKYVKPYTCAYHKRYEVYHKERNMGIDWNTKENGYNIPYYGNDFYVEDMCDYQIPRVEKLLKEKAK